MDIQALIGLGAAPLVIIALTAHIKAFAQATHRYMRPFDFVEAGPDPKASPWPLVADLLAVAWCWALSADGILQALLKVERIALPTIVLVGLALGIAAGQIRDRVIPSAATLDRQQPEP